MHKKKILIADSFEAMGGEEKVAFKIYKLLNREKYDVRITGTSKSKYLNVYKPENNELIHFFVKGKLSLVRMIKFRRLVKKEKFDIINVHGYSAGYFVRLACAGLKDVRIIWTMHLKITDLFKKHSIKVWIENLLNNHLFFTDNIVTVCKDASSNLIQRGNKNVPVNVIYNGINTNCYDKVERNKNDDSLVIGFFSRLSVQKDIPLLLQVMKEFQKEKRKIKLIIAGDGELKKQMLDFIHHNRLKNIEYIGLQDSVIQLFPQVDVCVLPTHTECLPMILLEALSSGTPAVASNVGGVSEIIENGLDGYVVPKEDVEAFKQAIINYYNHRNLIISHGKYAKEKMKQLFDQKIMIQKYEDLFDGDDK